MSYWQGVLARINVIGLVMVLVGAGLSFGAKKLVPLVFKDPDKMVLPVKFIGLLLAAAGAVIILV